MKKFFSLLLVLCMVMSLSVSAFAATESGSESAIPVVVNADAPKFSVTVPTGLPVAVNENGVVTCPDSGVAKVVNNSSGPVDVTGVTMVTKNGWNLVPFTTDFTRVKAGSKSFGFWLQGSNVPVTGICNANGFGTIDGNSSVAINYDASLATQPDGLTNVVPAWVVFVIGWHRNGSLADYAVDNTNYAIRSYAVLYDNGTRMEMLRSSDPNYAAVKAAEANVTAVYPDIDLEYYTEQTQRIAAQTDVPWNDYRESITRVDILDNIRPVSTRYWFYNFTNCEHIYGLDKLKMDKCESTVSMFRGCNNLEELDVWMWHMDTVEQVSMMFEGCSKITELDLSNWNLPASASNFTSFACNMPALRTIIFPNCQMTEMTMILQNDSALTNVDFSRVTFNNVSRFDDAFNGCSSLQYIVLDGISLNNMSQAARAFKNCSSLKRIYVDADRIGTLEKASSMYSFAASSIFEGCESLEGGVSGLTYADFEDYLSSSWQSYNAYKGHMAVFCLDVVGDEGFLTPIGAEA